MTGADGMLGAALRRRLGQLPERSSRCHWTDQHSLDIADAAAVEEYLQRVRPAVVINCAGLTDVDGCESDQERAMLVNGEAVGYLAQSCNSVAARLVHISTDFVFSGDLGRPYTEDDVPAPLNVYGRSKLLGEQRAALARQHLIVRTSWLYGPGGRNFVLAICRQALLRPELRVVNDQFGCPTYTDDLAEALWRMIEVGADGVYHACGAMACSWHDFAIEIVRLFRPQVRVTAMDSAELGRPARRPRLSAMNCDRLLRQVGHRLPGLCQSLPAYLSVINHEITGCEP